MRILAILCLAYVLAFGALHPVMSNVDYFYDSFEERNVYASLSHNPEHVNQEFGQLMLYLFGKWPNFTTDVFSQREMDHFEDVRNILVAAQDFFLLAAIFVLWYVFTFATEVERMIKQTILTLLFVLTLVAIWIAIDFMSFWILLHRLLFDNDLWLVQATDVIYILVPEPVFQGVVIRWLFVLLPLCAVVFFSRHKVYKLIKKASTYID